MAGIIFSEGSGVNDSIFGKSQAPIKMIIEKSGEAYEQESIAKAVFNMEKSANYAEKITSMTAMEGFQPVGENGKYPEDHMEEGFAKTLEHVTWKDRFSISREMIDDSKTLDLKKRPEAFMAGYGRTRERFAAALLGGGVQGLSSVKFAGRSFDTTTADGLSLFSKVHKSKLKGETQSNQFADAFSDDALAALECKMQGFKGDNGEILDVTPDTIIIPNDYKLKKAVFAAVGADKDPNTSNNGFNFLFGRWNIIVWAYLDQFITAGSSPWIVMSSKYNKSNMGAVWFDRTPLEVKSVVNDDNDANHWNGYARFSAGFNDWRAFAVGGVTGGTTLIS